MCKDKFLFLLLLLVFVASCKKENNKLPENNIDKIKSMQVSSFPNIYTYNNDGTIYKISRDDSNYSVFSINLDTISEDETYFTDNLYNYRKSFFVLNNNLAIHETYTSSYAQNYHHYNNLGYVDFTKIMSDNNSKNTLRHYYYDGANISYTFDTIFNPNNGNNVMASVDSTVYFYDYSKSNSLKNENFGMKFLGKSPENLVVKTIRYVRQFYPVTSNYTEAINYRYLYDSKGRVIQKNKDQPFANNPTQYYTYY